MEKLKVDQIVDTTSREANFWPERWIIVSVLSSLSDTLWSLIRIEGWQASPRKVATQRQPPPELCCPRYLRHSGIHIVIKGIP
ncbi:hypothetical protein CRG98_025520 [Punica granatum]|uniref:Uncharacterized protein n=1 Tax=Punica granatum TaxID=22663 RepID=A0A2I0JCW6_PUNGR|nr:hypothetical protein CRG98_025520 [Punica granatum]